MSNELSVTGGFFVPQNYDEARAMAEDFAKSSLIPKHLRGDVPGVMIVLEQANRWKLPPAAVMQETSVVHDKVCYGGKLIAAALINTGMIEGRLESEYVGTGSQRKIIVTGQLRGSDKRVSIEGTVADWQTQNQHWKKSTDSMLWYRGCREWARRYCPEIMIGGCYGPEEFGDPSPQPQPYAEPREIHAEVVHDTEAYVVIDEPAGEITNEDIEWIKAKLKAFKVKTGAYEKKKDEIADKYGVFNHWRDMRAIGDENLCSVKREIEEFEAEHGAA